MYPVSAAFLATLQEPSMRAITRIVTSNGIELFSVSGSVTMDSRRSITRTGDLELVPTGDLNVDGLYALLMSPSIELYVSRGLLVGGVLEYVPLAVLSTDQARKGKDTISWSGSDRAKKISRARFTDAYTIASGTSLAEAGDALLKSRWSYTPTDFANVSGTISAQIIYDAGEGSDPWQQARSLFEEFGYDLHFDGEGIARAIPIPDPATVAAVFDLGSDETNLVVDGETVGNFEQTYNGVIVTGEGTEAETPPRAEVWDTDPSSPTYYLSGFGLVPRFYSSPLLTTVEACQRAGETILAKAKGRSEQFSANSVVNPALEPLDVVTATLYGSTSRFVIDKLTVPLRASEAMSIIGRETSVQ